MRKRISIPLDGTVPSLAAILEAQGVPGKAAVDNRVKRLGRESVNLFRELAKPVGLFAEISKTDFENVYRGEGLNENEAPVENICRFSEGLALFAVTVGQDICAEITRLFDTNEPALGSMLDSAASEGTELAAAVAESHFAAHLKATGMTGSDTGTLRFSPGYCGWHLTGQKKLFEFIRPDEIGIELGENYLMRPLKSVSGVIVAGPNKIFEFDDTFPFCGECATHACRDRHLTAKEQQSDSHP